MAIQTYGAQHVGTAAPQPDLTGTVVATSLAPEVVFQYVLPPDSYGHLVVQVAGYNALGDKAWAYKMAHHTRTGSDTPVEESVEVLGAPVTTAGTISFGRASDGTISVLFTAKSGPVGRGHITVVGRGTVLVVTPG